MVSDEEYMREALGLAREGLGKTSPNPAVGALIVKNGKIVGRGHHHKAGEPHAEANALMQAGEQARGGTMYVTLEPCNHKGKTPACTEAIIDAGISRAVIGAQDPNPLVSGKGMARLRRAGIETESGLLEMDSKNMNEMYERYITTKKPFVIAKAALSADGKMAAKDGSSKWITGEEARRVVHELRAQVDAVMVGINTVLKDNPHLTCRITGGKNPVRIILDSNLRIPANANVLDKEADTIIVTTNQAPLSKMESLRKLGARVSVVEKNGGVDLKRLMSELGSEEITSIMIEGGGEVLGWAFDEGIVDKVMFFIAPRIVGGEGICISGKGVENIKDAIELERVEMKQVGNDFLLIGYPKK
jgi:diaminohydroxyphosphoribosylaminopyrimidine deaminase/5-amino-6-(5-phosphoribosylamino)uracil reductase